LIHLIGICWLRFRILYRASIYTGTALRQLLVEAKAGTASLTKLGSCIALISRPDAPSKPASRRASPVQPLIRRQTEAQTQQPRAMPRPRTKKRTAAEAAATDSSKPEAAAKEPAKRGRGKRVRALAEPAEYFPEKRNLVSRLLASRWPVQDASLEISNCVSYRFWYPRVPSVDSS
jgi:hypothetical protein